MSDFEVIIVGGGIAGASLGAEIAGKRRTLIIEAEEQCGYHSTGRSAAFFLESYGGPDVAKLSLASHAFLNVPPADFSARSFLRTRGDLHLAQGDLPKLPGDIETRVVERAELEQLVPGIRPEWHRALLEPGCADIDVAALHGAFLRRFRTTGGRIATRAGLAAAKRRGSKWIIELADGGQLSADVLVNAAGAWADEIALRSDVAPLQILPKRRTMVQLRVARSGLQNLPLVDDSDGTFYFKGEGDQTIWLSPHDEIPTEACDAAPEEIDVATAIDRFETVVDWPVERVERSWAGLRSFAPDRLPVYGWDRSATGFFWCAGQGGFGIQTSPAAAKMAAALLLGEELDEGLKGIDPAIFSPARFVRNRS